MITEDNKQLQRPNQRSGSRSGILCETRSCKKSKQKKIPQRGLGVAQLERIRLEEQKKKEAAAGASPYFIFPFPSDAASSVSQFESRITIPNHDMFNEPVSFPRPIPHFRVNNVNSYPAVPDFLPVSWDNRRMGDAQRADSQYAFRIPHDNSVYVPGLLPENISAQQFPTLVTVSSSPLSVSRSKLQIEPPSNQSCYSDPATSWPEEDRVVGMKPPWPVYFDDPSTFPTCSPCKFPRISTSYCRQGNPSHWSEAFKPAAIRTHIRCDKESEMMDGGFLSLGSSTVPFSQKFMQSLPPLASRNGELDLTGCQGTIEDTVDEWRNPQPWQRQLTFYRFLPVGSPSNIGTSTDEKGELSDGVDLNLRL